MIHQGRKPDAASIAKFLEALPDSLGLNDFRRSWPRYLFHIAEIDNAVSILDMGVLHCRETAIQLNLLVKDTAHPQVIGHTGASTKNCARFYFRPKTPTQHKTESFRRINQSEYPNYGIPVMLVFDAVEIMTRLETRFTDGNAGSTFHNEGDNLGFLRTIPFESVYHQGSFPREARDEIIHRRNAEVLVPGSVNLDGTLRWIGLRSDAELDTLLYRLRESSLQAYEKFRGLAVPDALLGEMGPLFFHEWTYLEEVWIAEGRLKLRLSREKGHPVSDFHAHLIVTNMDGTIVFTEKSGKATTATGATGTWSTPLPSQCASQPFVIEFRLDNRLAYRNSFPPFTDVVW